MRFDICLQMKMFALSLIWGRATFLDSCTTTEQGFQNLFYYLTTLLSVDGRVEERQSLSGFDIIVECEGGGLVYEGCCCNYLVSTNYWSICHNMSLILGLSIISHCCVTTLTSQDDAEVKDQWYLTDAWQPLQATTVFLLPYLLCRHLHTNIIQFYAISTYRESCARAL